MNKKIVSVILTIVMCMVPFGMAFASGNGMPTVTPNVGAGLGGMTNTVNNVLGVIKTIGYVVAIAMVMFAGIKYLMAGVGEKAKVKEMLFPMLAGAVLIAGAVTIVDWVFGIAK